MRKHFLQTIRMAASIMVALLGDDDQSLLAAVDTIVGCITPLEALERVSTRLSLLAARLQMMYLMQRARNEHEAKHGSNDKPKY